ncbi:hypothetical protein BGZ63DRAFT_377707 [Mariannaea sp. PMI_226]|nr:hypothetical protein BGZ63DRAFT_377707 [Mariannaea sp. PMI_226]
MTHLLSSKLPGLLDRGVLRLPFSNAIIMNERRVNIVNIIMTHCLEEHRVLVV